MRKVIFCAIVAAALTVASVAGHAQDVDVALVVGIDVSGSVNQQRFELQRRGAAEAISSAEFVEAVSGGRHHAVAIAVFEWSGVEEQEVIVPWTIVRTAEEAQAIAERLRRVGRAFMGSTAVGEAILFAGELLAKAPAAERRVVDISGDGRTNSGRPADAVRDRAVAAGIIVNGLPILDVETGLDEWYEENVQGGDGSFTIPARDLRDFKDAMLAKLIREVS